MNLESITTKISEAEYKALADIVLLNEGAVNDFAAKISNAPDYLVDLKAGFEPKIYEIFEPKLRAYMFEQRKAKFAKRFEEIKNGAEIDWYDFQCGGSAVLNSCIITELGDIVETKNIDRLIEIATVVEARNELRLEERKFLCIAYKEFLENAHKQLSNL